MVDEIAFDDDTSHIRCVVLSQIHFMLSEYRSAQYITTSVRNTVYSLDFYSKPVQISDSNELEKRIKSLTALRRRVQAFQGILVVLP